MEYDGSLTTDTCRRMQVDGLTFEYVVVPLGEYVDAGLLVALGHFARELGLPAVFRRVLKIRQKRLRYDPVDKVLTFFISLVDGCGYTSDINTDLKPFPALAHAWDLPEFAGQSAVNGTLHVLDWQHVQQIEQILHGLFVAHSPARRQPHDWPLVVDVDLKGVAVSPRSARFEWAERGYFTAGRNTKGLQFSAAFIGAPWREVLGGHLAPGYAHVLHGLPAILHVVEQRLGHPPRRADLLLAHARQVQVEARAQAAQAERCDEQIQRLYVQIGRHQVRQTQHQAAIQALRARIRRLPKRRRKLQAQVAEHQRQRRRARQRERRDRRRSAQLQTRAAQARQEAALLREAAQNLLDLAAAPVALGQTRLIILRADSSLGTGDTVTSLMERGFLFVVKGRDARTARALAAQIAEHEWQRVDPRLRAAEAQATQIRGCPFDVRLVVCERTTDRGQRRYAFLVTNLPPSSYATVALVTFYNQRQTIEAFNKVMGNTLSLDHLRTGSITANQAVALLAMLAHNFLSWAAHRFFAGTPYQDIAIREFVEKGLHMVARVTWPQPTVCRTELADDSPYARAFVAGEQGVAEQLPLGLLNPGALAMSKTE